MWRVQWSAGNLLQWLLPVRRLCQRVPFTSVQAAIDDLGAPTTITVCEGTYTGDITINRDLTLIGAGDGANPSFNTILQGTGSNSVVTISDAFTVSLQRVRITGGVANEGGGIFIAEGTLSLTDCTIVENDVMTSGGGIFNGGVLTVDTCRITGNTSGGTGGGIYSTNSLTATDLTVSRNDAGLGGGGIASSGELNLANSSIASNFAGGGFDGGGGILNTGTGTVTLIATDVGLNTASGTTVGGGIQQNGTSVILSGSNNKVQGNNPTNCAPPGAVAGCVG